MNDKAVMPREILLPFEYSDQQELEGVLNEKIRKEGLCSKTASWKEEGTGSDGIQQCQNEPQ